MGPDPCQMHEKAVTTEPPTPVRVDTRKRKRTTWVARALIALALCILLAFVGAFSPVFSPLIYPRLAPAG